MSDEGTHEARGGRADRPLPWRRQGDPRPAPPPPRTPPEGSDADDTALLADGLTALQAPLIPGVTLTREIGRGGIGIVFEGKQGYLDRRVAVKVLAGGNHGEEFSKRFQREAKVLASLNHPNIVACYQAGLASDGSCYLAMEIIDGPDLASWIEQHGPLPLQHAARICRDIAAALGYAHRSGIIHRDVKPANVLLQPDPSAPAQSAFPYRAKLADLGLARAAVPDSTLIDATLQDLTVQGAVMGSPPTMAPEQFDAPDQVDFRTDIYGLGCVLFHALTGKLAFPQGSLTSLIARKTRPDPPDPVQLRPDLPQTLSALVRSMLKPAREDRPQSYEEIVRQLEGPFELRKPGLRLTSRLVGFGAVAIGLALLGWLVASRFGGARPSAPVGAPPVLELDALAGWLEDSGGARWIVPSLPVRLAGRVTGCDPGHLPASISIDGEPVELDGEGRFELARFEPELDARGRHALRIEVVDAWERSDVREVSLVVDGAPPRLEPRTPPGVVAAAEGGWMTRAERVTLEVELVEESPDQVQAWRLDPESGARRPLPIQDSGQGMLRLVDIPLERGPNRFELVARDQAGNASQPLVLRIKRAHALIEAPRLEDAPDPLPAEARAALLVGRSSGALGALEVLSAGEAVDVEGLIEPADPTRFRLRVELPAEGQRWELEIAAVDAQGDRLDPFAVVIGRQPPAPTDEPEGPDPTSGPEVTQDDPSAPDPALPALAPGETWALLGGAYETSPLARWTVLVGSPENWYRHEESNNGVVSFDVVGVSAAEHELPAAPWSFSGKAQLFRPELAPTKRLAVVLLFAGGGGLALEQGSVEGGVRLQATRVLESGEVAWPAGEALPGLALGVVDARRYHRDRGASFRIDWDGERLDLQWGLVGQGAGGMVDEELGPEDLRGLDLRGPPVKAGFLLESGKAYLLDLVVRAER